MGYPPAKTVCVLQGFRSCCSGLGPWQTPYLPCLGLRSPFWVCILAFLGVLPAKLWEFPRRTSARALEPCSMFSGGGAALTEINSVGGSALYSFLGFSSPLFASVFATLAGTLFAPLKSSFSEMQQGGHKVACCRNIVLPLFEGWVPLFGVSVASLRGLLLLLRSIFNVCTRHERFLHPLNSPFRRCNQPNIKSAVAGILFCLFSRTGCPFSGSWLLLCEDFYGL